jgi:transposase
VYLGFERKQLISMSKFKSYNVSEIYLLPPSVNEFIPKDHLSRVISEVVEQIDTTNIENKYSHLGQKSYHPKIMLKILYYGYCIGIRSGRKISKRCETDTAFMYLSAMQQPDFRTVNDFRKDNLKQIEGYFVDVLQIGKGLGLAQMGHIYVDGTKIRANASAKRTKDKEGYKKWLKRIEENIEKIMKEVEQTDKQEDELYGKDKRGDGLPQELQKQEALRKKIKKVLHEIKDEEKINLTDKEARNIKGKTGGIRPNYNCQAGATSDGMIVSAHVSTNASDCGELTKAIDQSEQNTKEKVTDAIADGGYGTYDNYEELEKRGITAYIPSQKFAKEQKQKHKENKNPYDKDEFNYDKGKDEYICPEGKRLIYKGISSERTWKYNVYKGVDCANCKKKHECTKKKSREIRIEIREEIKQRVLERLKTEKGKETYNKRSYKIEPLFGHLKFNLKYQMFLLRGEENVNGEFTLMCTTKNIYSIYKQKLQPKRA